MIVASGGPRPAPGTLTELFFDAVERYDRADALQVKVNGQFQPIPHRTLLERVRRTALALRARGLAPGDRVAILSENRPEWAITDFACLTARLPDVSIYPTLPPAQVAYILHDSRAAAIFVSTAAQAAKVAEVRAQLPDLRHVVSFEPAPGAADLSLADLEREGAEHDSPETAAAWRADALSVAPDDVATILYTSGTTGEPKGAMLTHDNIWSNVRAVDRVLPLGASAVSLSFLPLSHILERMAGHYLMFATGTSIAYAESIDTVAADLQLVRPTFMVSVPRLYEKMYARVLEAARQGGAVKARLFHWARGVGARWVDARLAGHHVPAGLALQYALADRLVFSKIRARTGGRLANCVSGGAPLAPEIIRFFYAAGIVIYEGYGLTETSPVISVNTPDNYRVGTVGRPIAGVSVAIAPDGEILTRGPNVMKGYFNRPDATADAIDLEGWFHTGDIGELHDEYLTITDRKKDIIVTAGGKNIAPQPIELRIRQNKYVSQAVMIGDRRPFPSVIVVPNFEQLERWARRRGLAWSGTDELIALPEVRDKMSREVLVPLDDLAHFETPRKILLLARDFSLEGGELTPTLKVRRRVVDARYRTEIDALYSEAAPASAPADAYERR